MTDADPVGLPSFDVQFEIQDETGWAEALVRALVVLRPLSEGYVIPQANVPERQRPETPVLRIFAPNESGREAVMQLHRLITDRRLHLFEGVPKLVTEDRGLFDGLRNVTFFVEGLEFDLSMVLVGSAILYGSMGISSLDDFIIATLDAMTHESLIMALTSGAPQPVERLRGNAGAAYRPSWAADLPVLLSPVT